MNPLNLALLSAGVLGFRHGFDYDHIAAKVHQLRRAVIGGDIPDAVLGRLQPASSEFLSADLNLFNLRVVAQYSVSEPKDFLAAR
jgi:hypothetical protein